MEIGKKDQSNDFMSNFAKVGKFVWKLFFYKKLQDHYILYLKQCK